MCENIASWNDAIMIGQDIEYEDFVSTVLQCQEEMEDWAGAKYNHATDHPNADKYCNSIFEKIENGESVKVKDLAYWEFTDLDRYFNCIEDIVEHGRKELLDNAIRTCWVFKKLDASKFKKMSKAVAYEADEAIKKVEELSHLMMEVYSKIWTNSSSGWVEVVRQGEDIATKPVPVLEIHLQINGNIKREVLGQYLQAAIDVGLALEWVENDGVLTAQFFDLSQRDIISKVDKLSDLLKNGLEEKEDVDVLAIGIVAHFELARKAFLEGHGSEAALVAFECAINPDTAAGKQIIFQEDVPAIEAKTTTIKTEAPTTETAGPLPTTPPPEVADSSNVLIVSTAILGAAMAAMLY
jgi:hypothetical protein